MTNRALCVGINQYPDAPLQGCVNDVEDMVHHLTTHCGFQASDIKVLKDKAATTKAIRSGLQWLVKDLKAGDRVLFQYSGHGAQAPTKNPAGEVDGLDEIICPVDFDWSDAKMIRDKEFHSLFSTIPKDVDFVWVSDSCHSGDLVKAGLKGGPVETYCVPRTLPTPPAVTMDLIRARDLGLKAVELSGVAAPLNLAFVSGCGSRQTSADAYFAGRYNGALSYFLLRSLAKEQGLSIAQVVKLVRDDLLKGGYSQVPEVHGVDVLLTRPFLFTPTHG